MQNRAHQHLSWMQIWQVLAAGLVVALLLIGVAVAVLPEYRKALIPIVLCAVLAGVFAALALRDYLRVQLRLRDRELRELEALAKRLDLLDLQRGREGRVNYAETHRDRTHLLKWISEAADHLLLLRQVTEGVYGVEALFDTDIKLVWISPSVERLTGYRPQECMEQDANVLDLLVDESDLRYCARMARLVLDGGEQQDFEMRLNVKTGGVCWVACHWRPMLDDQGVLAGLRMSAEDVQARKKAEHQLLETVAELRRAQALREHYLSRSNEERQRLAALLNVIRLAILFIDQDSRALYYNRAMLELWGLPLDENLIGTRDVVLLSMVLPLLKDPEGFRHHNARIITAGVPVSTPYEIEFKDGRIVTVVSALVENENGKRGSRVWIYEDVTERRTNAAKLIELAERDPLTNLYNRRRFHEELERLLADAARRSTQVGLVSIDLDGFKPINDELGHQAGDAVLVGLARQVGDMIRRNEMFFRLGGDEFALLVPDTDETALSELANRLVVNIAGLRFRFGERECSVTASIGIALYPQHGCDSEALMAASDEAMYCSKAGGRNRWMLSVRHTGGDSQPLRH